MADAKREKARRDLRRAQANFERAQSQRDKASAARRKSIEHARAAGFSMREIGQETGLHFSRVAEILQGK
jgi:multidrug resistance efflux pump